MVSLRAALDIDGQLVDIPRVTSMTFTLFSIGIQIEQIKVIQSSMVSNPCKKD